MDDGMKIEPCALQGGHVDLSPVTSEDREEMREVLDHDPDIWNIYLVSGYREHFPLYFDMMLNTANRLAYAIREKASGRLVGTSSMFQIDPHHRSMEIGYTWYIPSHRGTWVNPETKLLMLSHAFECGALRVQFGVDTRNARSMAAMAKFARLEGILRRHKVSWTGYHRDTAIYSVIDSEWPDVEQQLKTRLERNS